MSRAVRLFFFSIFLHKHTHTHTPLSPHTGGHAGDPDLVSKTIARAAEVGACVGAHPAYPDRENFGRERMNEMSAQSLRDHVLWQVGSLQSLCLSVESTQVKYIKPHGALYHAVMEGGPHADAVMEAAKMLDLPLLLMPTSPLASYGEAFAERRYDGNRLRDRKLNGAVIHDPQEAGEQALNLAAVDGVDSVCVHGDSPNAVEVARVVRCTLEDNGWLLRSFINSVSMV